MRVNPHIPDELFFPTVLMNSPAFNGSAGKLSTVPPYRLPNMHDMNFIRSTLTTHLRSSPRVT